MTPLDNLESIADGIRELYPTAKATVAIDLPRADIDQILSHFGEEGQVVSDILKTYGTTVALCIKQVTFAISERKIDPQMN